MRYPITKFCLLAFLLVFFSNPAAYSQNLTGIWRGHFTTEYGDQYKFEIQIKQTRSSISGVSYSYLNTVFYGKATLTGNYNKTGKTALVREIKTTELRMAGGSSACIMKCVFEYSQMGKEEFLEGTFTSKFEKNGYGTKKGDDCGGGRVTLRKVTTSDFYIEPFLRKNLTPTPPVRKDSVKKRTEPTTRTSPPVVNNKPVTKPPVTKPPVTRTQKPPVVKNNTNTSPNTGQTNTTKVKTDTATKIDPPVTKQPVAVPVPNVLKTRTNELVKTLVVSDENVVVKLYDNGEIDDDTISVYMDKKLVLSSKRLTASPLIVKLKMDEDNSEHELVMVAENLGRIPPNTSLMIVESGDKRFDVRITSTEQQNAVVRFRYEKPGTRSSQ